MENSKKHLERKKKMLTGVIHITNFGESPQNAVKSIITNKGLFNEVHFIYPSFENEEESMYKGWAEDREALKPLSVFFHVALHAKAFNSDSIIVEIPPTCEAKAGAFSMIKSAMKSAGIKQNQFAVSSTIVLPEFSIWSGFFIVLLLIEWFWGRIFERGKLYEYTDLRAHFVLKKGSKIQWLPEEHGGRLFNDTHIPKGYGDSALLLKPTEEHFLLWKLYTHSHLKFSYWLIPYFTCYFVFTVSWISIFWGAFTFSNAYFFSYVIFVWLMEFLISYKIGSYYISCPYRIVYSILFPAYWVLFPFVLIYARLSVPQKTWK